MQQLITPFNLLYQWQKAQVAVSSLSPKNGNQRSALLIPPSGTPGGLGDDAMLTASSQYLAQQGFEKIGIISFGHLEAWDNIKHITHVVPFGTRWNRLQVVNHLRHYNYLFCVGADVMDGYYGNMSTIVRTKLLNLAAGLNICTTILGFSWNQNPTPESVKALEKLPHTIRICARDILSQNRLKQRLNRPIELVSDLAFLLESDQNSKLASEVTQWIYAQQSNNRTVIGVNLNNLFVGAGKKLQPSELIKYFVSTLTELSVQDSTLSFLLIPHDSRGQVSDLSLAQELLQALPPALRPYCSQVPFPCRAAEIKAICAELDFVLTGRMHLAIACLGQTTPVGCITYQGKFEGLFQHFQMSNVTISPEEAFRPEHLSQFVLHLLAQREELRAQIQIALPKVMELAKSNFSGVSTLQSVESPLICFEQPLP